MGGVEARVGYRLRSCARLLASEEGGRHVFVAGNAIELLSPGHSSGPRHSLSRVFDTYTDDASIFEEEVKPLLAGVAEGVNGCAVLCGGRWGGRARLLDAIAPLAISILFNSLDEGRAGVRTEGKGTYSVRVTYCGALGGSSSHLLDLLSPGCTEVAVTRDANAPGGMRLEPIASHAVVSPARFAELWGRGRARLRERGGDALSSLLLVDVETAGGTPEHCVASLLIADVEVISSTALASLSPSLPSPSPPSDSISAALTRALAKERSGSEPISGVDLLFAHAIGGNSCTLLLGLISPARLDEAGAILRLLAQGVGVQQSPLPNNPITRGLIRWYEWRLCRLEQLLSLASGKLASSVAELEEGAGRLPRQLASTTERLQGLVDHMQQEAGGHAGERQELMGQVSSLRAQVNAASGQADLLREELVREKEEKMALSRELISVQLSGSQSNAEQQQRLFELEQQALASADVMQQLQIKLEHNSHAAAESERARDAAEADCARLKDRELGLTAQLITLRSEVEELREREDELTLQLLNSSNALSAAEKANLSLSARADGAESEKEEALARAERAEEAAARRLEEALKSGEEARRARVEGEEARLQAEQEALAARKQAAQLAEQQQETIRQLQEEEEALRVGERGGVEEKDSRLRETIEEAASKEAAMQREMKDLLAQLRELQAHTEALSSAAREGGEESGESNERGGMANSLAAQLHSYQHTVNDALSANRALHEAYWRLRAVVREGSDFSLPSHEELQLGALLEPGSGRRELPSEAEKLLLREKAELQALCERREMEVDQAEARYREAVLSSHPAASEEQIKRTEQMARESDERAQRLQERVAELEGGVEREEESRALVEELRASQEALLAQIEQLRQGGDMGRVAESAGEVKALRMRLESTEAKLSVAEERIHLPVLGGSFDAQRLQLHVRELTRVQGELERERTELTRRAVHAEAQLAEMQQYLTSNIGRYQKEILRLRRAASQRPSDP